MRGENVGLFQVILQDKIKSNGILIEEEFASGLKNIQQRRSHYFKLQPLE